MPNTLKPKIVLRRTRQISTWDREVENAVGVLA